MENRLPLHSEFKKQLKKRYKNNQIERDARKRLHFLKTSDFDHDIHKYNDESDALASLIGYNNSSEDSIISLYKHGLNLQYFREVDTREAESLKEAIRITVNCSIKREQSRKEKYRTVNHNKWKGSKYEKLNK